MKTIRILLIFLLVFTACVFAQDTAQQEYTTVFGDLEVPKEYSRQDVQVIDIEYGDFETAEQWSVRMPREQGLALKKRVTGQVQEDDSGSKYCLGVKCKPFVRGFNWIEVKPPTPLRVPGTTKALSVWVLGRNFRHKLYAWVKDYRGIEYKIYMGQLNFMGWKRVSALIPHYVKQYSRYVPQYKPLYFTKFVIEFDPDELPVAQYIYLDRLQAATDMYKYDYDGADFLDPESGEERWETELWNYSEESASDSGQ